MKLSSLSDSEGPRSDRHGIIERYQALGFRDRIPIREICRRTGLSRNTIRKYLRSDEVEPEFRVPDRPSKLAPYAEKLAHWLKIESGRSRKQKRTVIQLHADLAARSYGRVAAFARDWKANRLRDQQMSGPGTFVPLAFEAGETFQFDWSEDWAVLGGVPRRGIYDNMRTAVDKIGGWQGSASEPAIPGDGQPLSLRCRVL